MTATQDPDSPTSDDLNHAERALLKAATTGTVVDLRTGNVDLDNPANAADWDGDRNVRADFLADLLTGDRPTESGRLRSVKLRGARITGTLDLEARKLLYPVLLQDCYFEEAINLSEAEAVSIRFPGCHVPELSAARLKTTGSAAFNFGFTAHGETRLVGAHIGGQLQFIEASLTNDNGPALNAAGLATSKAMFCIDGFTANDGIVLTNAKVGTFHDDQDSWPDKLRIRGFTYEALGNQSVGTSARLQWLQRHDGPFTPQIYDQLAEVYRRTGDDGAARKVAVTKQWRRRKPYNPLSWLWWVTVGYGYRTWQAFIWAAALTVVGTLVFSDAYPAHMAALNTHPPRFQPVIYALDVLLPIGGLGQKGAWQPTGGYLDWYWALAIAGWVLSAAVVAGLTGILKRD